MLTQEMLGPESDCLLSGKTIVLLYSTVRNAFFVHVDHNLAMIPQALTLNSRTEGISNKLYFRQYSRCSLSGIERCFCTIQKLNEQ